MFNSKYYDHGGILVFRDTTNQLFYHCFPISDRIRLNNIDYLLSNQRICAVAEGQDVIDGNHLIRYSSIVSNLSEISKMIGVCFPESLSTSSIAIQNSSLVINGVMLKNIDESIKLYFGDKEIFKAKILLDSHVGSQSALVTDSNFLINHRLASFDPDLLGGIRYIISAINSKNGIISHCKVPIDQKSEILAVHYNQERLKQLVHDNKSTEILIWLIVKDYQNLSLLNTSMSHKKLAQEISKCYMFIDSIVIHRLLRHLPSDDILTRVDKFIKHHHAALESKIIESLFSIQSDTQRVQRSVDDIIVSSTTTMCSDELEEVSSKNSSRSDTNNLSDEILQGNKEIFGEVIDDVNHY